MMCYIFYDIVYVGGICVVCVVFRLSCLCGCVYFIFFGCVRKIVDVVIRIFFGVVYVILVYIVGLNFFVFVI